MVNRSFIKLIVMLATTTSIILFLHHVKITPILKLINEFKNETFPDFKFEDKEFSEALDAFAKIGKSR